MTPTKETAATKGCGTRYRCFKVIQSKTGKGVVAKAGPSQKKIETLMRSCRYKEKNVIYPGSQIKEGKRTQKNPKRPLRIASPIEQRRSGQGENSMKTPEGFLKRKGGSPQKGQDPHLVAKPPDRRVASSRREKCFWSQTRKCCKAEEARETSYMNGKDAGSKKKRIERMGRRNSRGGGERKKKRTLRPSRELRNCLGTVHGRYPPQED